MNWKQFLRENGYKYTIKELMELLPNISKDRIRSWCYDNNIPYIRQYELKDKTPKKHSNYFNVKEHETWLI